MTKFADVVRTGVSLVDFWAGWCPPCKLQSPILQDVAKRLGDRAKVIKVNIETHPELADQFGVRSVPTLMVFKDGVPVTTLVGLKTAPTLVSAVEQQLMDSRPDR